MRKILLIGICCLLATFAGRAQSVTECSFYIKFKGNDKNYASLQKAHAQEMNMRKVRSELLFPVETRTSGHALNGMAEYAFSLHVGESLRNSYRIDFECVDNVDKLYNELKAMSDVIEVERVEAVEIFEEEFTGNMPDDPLLQLVGTEGGWHLTQIGFDKIYGKYQGNPDVKVAVIDNAVWGEHPDLQVKPENQYFAYIDEEGSSAPPSTLDQETECASILKCPISEWSHGTHCAGLVAALSNNDEGTASFASGVTLLTARSADIDPRRMVKAFEGVLWAIDRGANLLSLSWGSSKASQFEKEIVEAAIERNITIVAAAGNDGVNAKTYPAAYEGVIAVGSVDSDSTRSVFSNYGDWVTIGAPGGFLKDEYGNNTGAVILSTTYSSSQQYRIDGFHEVDGMFYDGKAGTSMATPLVASVIGLMLSINPALTPEEITNLLQETATKMEDWDMSRDGGVIDAAKAIETVAKNLTSIGKRIENKCVLYFNQVTNCVEINLDELVKELVITDMVGNTRVRLSDVVRSEVSMAELPQGVYIVRAITIDDETHVAKFVKE